MENTQKIEIAIAMLGSSIRDRHWNRLTHFQRNIITNNVINILENLLKQSERNSDLIIPNYRVTNNPPDES